MQKVHDLSGWVVVVNTDLTEGRGYQVPLAVCDLEATARRLAEGANVQGSNGEVYRVPLTACPDNPHGATLCGPIHLISPSTEDHKVQVQIDKHRKAVQRARDAGLSEEDIQLLVWSK